MWISRGSFINLIFLMLLFPNVIQSLTPEERISYWCGDDAESQERHEEASQILSDLYDAANGSNWNHNYLWKTQTCICNWSLVDCVSVDRYIALFLGSNNLKGDLPDSIGSADIFIILQFNVNNLYGTIPNSLTLLPSLRSLFLNNNNFIGTIPEFTTPFSNFTANNNQLGGFLPEFLFESSASAFRIDGNGFWCPLPDWCAEKEDSCGDCYDPPTCSSGSSCVCAYNPSCCAATWGLEEDCFDILDEHCDCPNDNPVSFLSGILAILLFLLAVFGMVAIGACVIVYLSRKHENWDFFNIKKSVRDESKKGLMDFDEEF